MAFQLSNNNIDEELGYINNFQRKNKDISLDDFIDKEIESKKEGYIQVLFEMFNNEYDQLIENFNFQNFETYHYHNNKSVWTIEEHYNLEWAKKKEKRDIVSVKMGYR